MIERCRIAHFDDLKHHQQVQMLEVLNRTEGAAEESHPAFALNGGRPVALLKDEKVVAAMVTDEHHNILHWSGIQSRKFLQEVGHSPAIALMRAHLAQRGDGKIKFVGEPSDAATNLFYNRFFVQGKTDLSKQGNTSTIAFSPELVEKLKPKITSTADTWRIHQPG